MKILIPQVPLEIEIKILSFKADLDATDRHHNNIQKLNFEFYQQVHCWSRAECWCRTPEMCRCIKGKLSPSRIKNKYYLGYGFRDMIQEWTSKLRMGWLCLRCTKCTRGCPCQVIFPGKIRNGQVLTHEGCDKQFLEWASKGRKTCWNEDKECDHCERCDHTKLVWVKPISRDFDIIDTLQVYLKKIEFLYFQMYFTKMNFKQKFINAFVCENSRKRKREEERKREE